MGLNHQQRLDLSTLLGLGCYLFHMVDREGAHSFGEEKESGDQGDEGVFEEGKRFHFEKRRVYRFVWQE